MTLPTDPLMSANNPALTHPAYRPDIDGLRAIAVLAVVAFHAFPLRLPGGFIGVDVFFVISGFLISTIILRSLERGAFSFAHFYARRINRIFPALLTVLVACYLFGGFVLFADEYAQLGKHMAGGAGFVANLMLWRESGYFDLSAEVKPLLHLWSLGIEEQFYIVWPVLAWVAWKARLQLFGITLVAAGISFAWNIAHIASDPVSAFYLPHARVWELLAGALLACLQSRHPQRVSVPGGNARGLFAGHPTGPAALRMNNAVALGGVAALAFGFLLVTRENAFPGWWATLPVLGTFLLIAAGPGAWVNRHVLAARPLVWIGLISYPLYLWHWPLLSLARIIEGETPSREIRMAAVALSMLLAWLTYRFIETPLRARDSRWKTPVLLGLMAGVGTLGYLTFISQGLPDRPVARLGAAFHGQFTGSDHSRNDRCVARYPFKDAESYGWWFCAASRDEAPSLILLGNSFANHLYGGLASGEHTQGHSILSIGACSLGIEEITDPHAPTTTHPCSGNRPHRQKLFINSIVEQSPSLKYAIIDGLDPVMDDAYIARVSERIGFLEAHGVKVIVFVPHITVARDIKSCFSRPLKTTVADCTLPVSVRQEIDNGFAPLIEKISAAHPTVTFFDQNELFCDAEGCSLTLDGMPIFGDQYSHYSAYVSAKVAERLSEWAQRHAPGLLVAPR